MSFIKTFQQKLLNPFRHRLADIDALPQLTLLGIIIGCTAGLLIIVFRMAIDVPLSYFLPDSVENFEGLNSLWHFSLPIIGALLIATGLYFTPERHRHFSVGQVLERLHNYQGRMHWINMVVQFIGATISLITGFSVGREGPAVHLGASTGSLVAQLLNLPNNSMRTLLGCGVAAAIAACFNTPVAGVIFAMEVVLISYSIISFIPIMMASFCGALLSRTVFGEEVFISIVEGNLHGLWEIPFMITAGLVVALFATLYMRLQLFFSSSRNYPIFWRILAAGLLTGLIGLFLPQILGLGYDTINLSVQGEIGFKLLLGIALAKILVTSFSIGMGVPGGLIGPQLFIGACVGGMIGILGNAFFPNEVSSNGVYVLLGMAAMMGAVLNAPLAALMAVMELTYNPSVIFPSMLIIVVSCVATRHFYHCDGIFVEQLRAKGTTLQLGPLKQILSNIGVRSAMTTTLVETPEKLDAVKAKGLLQSNPLWIVIHCKTDSLLLRAADLAIALERMKGDTEVPNTTSKEQQIDLLEIPGQRLNLIEISELSSLYEAKELLDGQVDTALLVTSYIRKESKVLGVITQEVISHHYM